MSPYRRNVMVGATILVAMIALGWMIVQFGGRILTPFTPPRTTIKLKTDRADGLADGSPVLYHGVNVGQVRGLERDPDQKHVYIKAEVDARPALPGNLRAIIRSQGLIGSGSQLVLETDGPEPIGELKNNEQLEARYIGLDILPPGFANLADELRLTSQEFREGRVVAHVAAQVQKAGTVM